MFRQLHAPTNFITWVLFALLSAACTSGAVESSPPLLEKPALPLMGIVRVDSNQSLAKLEESVQVGRASTVLSMYEGLHVLGPKEMKANKALWNEITAAKPGFMILPYFQSTLAHKQLGVPGKEVEKDPLKRMSMYLEGTLERAIDSTAVKFRIVPDDRERGFGLKASSVSGDFSRNIHEYIFPVRIGEEIMKVVAVDPEAGEVTVIRGYKNTKAARHEAGAKVFAPVYRGKRSLGSNPYGTSSRYPDHSDGGSGQIPQYHMRLDSRELMAMVAGEGAEYLRKGATGLWLDLTSSGIFIPCNAYGFRVQPWNFELNEPYTPETYAGHQDVKCQLLRELIKEKTGVTPVLVANNHANGKYFRGGMDLVRSTSRKPEPIEGVTLEAAFCFYQARHWFPLKQWKTNLSTLIHGAQNGQPVWPWIKSVKYAMLPMPDNSEAERFQFFDYASTLLGYEKDAGIICPMPLFKKNDQQQLRFNLPEYVFYDIGEPVERVTYDRIDDLLIPGKNTYMRKWSKAIILVNPTETDDPDIAVPEGFIDPETKMEVGAIDMPAHTAKILLRAAKVD